MEQRRHYHHGFLKERLLELGEAALRDNKFEQTSLRDLAKKAGVSHSAPYRHFADRDALEMALLEKELDQLFAATKELDEKLTTDSFEKFQALGRKLVTISVAGPHRFELLMTAKSKNLSPRVIELKNQLSRLLLRWTVEGLRSRGLRNDFEPIDALKLIWAVIAGAIKVGQSHFTHGSPLDSRDEAHRILDTALSAIFKS